MTECYQKTLDLGRVQRRRLEAEFSGGEISSNGGVALLRQVDQRLGLSAAMAHAMGDPRRQASCRHRLDTLLRQRVYAIALGYEDVNDHEQLRFDAALQSACGQIQSLGSASTVGRVERRAERDTAWALHKVLVEQFIASFETVPEELVLDFDATDDAVHGQQEGRFFHGYYDGYCFLPLYVTCGEQLLVSYLRPSNIDGCKHAWAILSLLVRRLRQSWPGVRIIFRADSGFCRWRLLRWCEDHQVGYIVGLARNRRLQAQAAPLMDAARTRYQQTDNKQRLFERIEYAAGPWDRSRSVLVKAEHSLGGANPRFVVTNLAGDAQSLYDRLYCARGNMENRIKEQMQLFADRTSAHRWWPNQFRLLLSSAAYVLMQALRRLALADTALARAEVNTLRLKLLRIGAVILINTRRIRLLLPTSYPYQSLFTRAVERLNTS